MPSSCLNLFVPLLPITGASLISPGGEQGTTDGQFRNWSLGACFTSLGSVAVADAGNGRVLYFSREGLFEKAIGAGTLKCPTDVACLRYLSSPLSQKNMRSMRHNAFCCHFWPEHYSDGRIVVVDHTQHRYDPCSKLMAEGASRSAHGML
jgi:hypothetical protein